MTEQPRTKTQINDATGKTVAENVRRLREKRGWSTYNLSAKLKEVGRPIAPSAVAKVERAERRVDVGDLAALAAVLDASPAALLLPLDDDPDHLLDVTGAGRVPADAAWAWAFGQRPLKVTPGREDADLLEYQLNALPPAQVRMRQQPLWRALQAADESVGDLLREGGAFVEGDDDYFADQVHRARRALERVGAELDHLEGTRAAEAAKLKRWAEAAKKPGEGDDGTSLD
ncbi:helix-turn-helix domain-containing protein [Streptomyces cinereoruber]|uniref:helix-turn-helix domain-containing protein n=1 Tax=Streptomyces cinereoruber TaxID=67260 RepID=UPI0033998F29